MVKRCGTCKFWKDFTRGEDGYPVGSHCRVRQINFYGDGDKSPKPRQAFLPVGAHDGPCDMYAEADPPARRRAS